MNARIRIDNPKPQCYNKPNIRKCMRKKETPMMNDRLSLNGTWQIDYLSPSPYTETAEPSLPTGRQADSITPCPVPGYWEDLLDIFRTTTLHTKLSWNPLYTYRRYPEAGYVPDMALPNPVGCFVYKRTFTVSSEFCGTETFLSVGGAQNTVSAWINGQYLGRHEGYSAPFGFSVPAGVLIPGENRITLAVSNTRLAGYKGRPVSGLTSRAANECTGGIYGDVELHLYKDGVRDLFVTVAGDCSVFTVHWEGGESAAKTLSILDGGKTICTVNIAAGESNRTLSAEKYIRWTPATPHLYTAVLTTENQQIERRFGIRRLTSHGTKLHLNGEPYYFRGTCEHCYQPLTVHPTRDKAYYRAILHTLKSLGFNSIRFHTWVPMEEYMEAADEMGMLIEVETPNNTSFAEWEEIVRFCRRHTSVAMYSSGNELQIDNDYEEHLRACADLVHRETDSLFSPMSAMRGIEYVLTAADEVSDTPFSHNPKRLAAVGAYSDVYNSYSLGLTSYRSDAGTAKRLDYNNAIYKKPLLSHEICIHGTYCDLSLMNRYQGTRIGDTAFMSSVEEHLADRGLLDRANLYYRNSCVWQAILRKDCFETVRRCETFAGYDFLGDIDTHWHTFGYCVGMMNEFYELKPGETVQNVRRYNSDTVLLADLPACRNLTMGDRVHIPILASHYGKAIEKSLLQICIRLGETVIFRKEIRTGTIPAGEITKLYECVFTVPRLAKPAMLQLSVTLSGGDTDAENRWELYAFPKCNPKIPSAKVLRAHNLTVTEDISGTQLWNALSAGKNVLLLGPGPFASQEVSFQLSVAGRTNGHLATVISDHPLTEDFPHEGVCGWQFRHMLNGSRSAVLDLTEMPHDPIIDIASSYKNAHREAMLFEYRVGKGKLLACTLHLSDEDPGAQYLKSRLFTYAMSDRFQPKDTLSYPMLAKLCTAAPILSAANTNEALNLNDVTM